MKFRAAIALIALAVPAMAQHGGGHAGSGGSHGFGGHAGFSGSAGFQGSGGFSRSGSFARPAQVIPYGAQRNAGYRGILPPSYSRLQTPYSGDGLMAARTEYASRSGALPRGAANGGDRNGNRDRDRWDRRRRSFNNWYTSIYPAWTGYGYPYLIDSGFYDWGDTDSGAADESDAAPYPDYGYGAPDEPAQDGYGGELQPWNPQWGQPADSGVSPPPAPGQPLTVIFKGGRAPVTMQNYMMTAKALTDLDSQHYEQIPLDEIDVAATQRANSAAGVEFEVPGA